MPLGGWRSFGANRKVPVVDRRLARSTYMKLDRQPRIDMRPIRIKRLRDFLDEVGPRSPGLRRYFRGQSIDKPLLPGIARWAQEYGFEPLAAERNLLSDFKRRARPFLGSLTPSGDLEWMALAQHNRLATRLLDWTGAPLIGLWFAVEKDPEGDVAVVWDLDASSKHEALDTFLNRPFEANRTFLFEPPHISSRISAQAAWFTCHRYVEGRGKYYPLEKQARFRHELRKFVIDRADVSSIRRELRALGMNRAAIYPDLEGVASHLMTRVHEQRDRFAV